MADEMDFRPIMEVLKSGDEFDVYRWNWSQDVGYCVGSYANRRDADAGAAVFAHRHGCYFHEAEVLPFKAKGAA